MEKWAEKLRCRGKQEDWEAADWLRGHRKPVRSLTRLKQDRCGGEVNPQQKKAKEADRAATARIHTQTMCNVRRVTLGGRATKSSLTSALKSH